MKLKRNYLTTQEVGIIAVEVAKEEDDLAREILRIGLVAQALVDFDEKYESCDDYYNAVMASDIDIEKDIKNFSSVDRIVTDMTGTDRVLKDAIKDIDETLAKSIKKIPKDLKNVNMESILTQFKEILEAKNGTN